MTRHTYYTCDICRTGAIQVAYKQKVDHYWAHVCQPCLLKNQVDGHRSGITETAMIAAKVRKQRENWRRHLDRAEATFRAAMSERAE